ncbi:unnamed protein product [Arabis nemorensis]|uniref:Uncharacterized protein n=1 Tax=Arabis nemorensis TaxID=586526 RepID=A0A565CLI4_9BRAS|nr:unnamed protein product [Arabis nemorensis]
MKIYACKTFTFNELISSHHPLYFAVSLSYSPEYLVSESPENKITFKAFSGVFHRNLLRHSPENKQRSTEYSCYAAENKQQLPEYSYSFIYLHSSPNSFAGEILVSESPENKIAFKSFLGRGQSLSPEFASPLAGERRFTSKKLKRTAINGVIVLLSRVKLPGVIIYFNPRPTSSQLTYLSRNRLAGFTISLGLVGVTPLVKLQSRNIQVRFRSRNENKMNI